MSSFHSIWMRNLEQEDVSQPENGVYFGIFSDLPERIAARLDRPRAPFLFGSLNAPSTEFTVWPNSESSDSMSSSADQDVW
jgi:hypothetical protein